MDEDERIYKLLREFTESFLLPESVLQIFRGEFCKDFETHLPKLIDVIHHPNFKFLFDKFKQVQGEDQISHLFKLMMQVESRIVEFYRNVLNLQPTKQDRPKIPFSDLCSYRYLLQYLYEISPKNQQTIEGFYFAYRQNQFRLEVEQLQSLFKQYQFEQPSLNEYFDDAESVSDFNLFMPLLALNNERNVFKMLAK